MIRTFNDQNYFLHILVCVVLFTVIIKGYGFKYNYPIEVANTSGMLEKNISSHSIMRDLI